MTCARSFEHDLVTPHRANLATLASSAELRDL